MTPPHQAHHSFFRFLLLLYLLPGFAVGIALAFRYFWGFLRQRAARRAPWSYLLGIAWLLFTIFVVHAEIKARLHLNGNLALLGFVAVPLWWAAFFVFLVSRRRARRTNRAVAPATIILPLPPSGDAR